MPNKEKLNNSINNDFNKVNNYNKIIKKIEGVNMKYKKIVWKISLIPICLAIILGNILFINYKNDENKSLNSKDSYSDSKEKIEIYINNIDKLGATLIDADVKVVNEEENSIWISIVSNIVIPEQLEKKESYMLYTRKDKESPYDILNSYVYNYYNEETLSSIRISFSNKNKPLRDYHFSEEGAKETTINNVKMKIFKYENIYFTEFNYKDYNFDIETTNITQDELINLLKSII